MEYWSNGKKQSLRVARYVLRVQFFNPQRETRNAQQSLIICFIGAQF